MTTAAPDDVEEVFLTDLHMHGLLLSTGVAGLYGRGSRLADVLERLESLITRLGRTPDTEIMRFPPVMSRRTLEKCGYFDSFPQLAGSIYTFTGDEDAHICLQQAILSGEDRAGLQSLSDMALAPVVCYSVYPQMRGELPLSGRTVDVQNFCFRHEPSRDPGRMQSFLMREFVYAGELTAVLAWRDGWIARGRRFLAALELDPQVAPANDPFFGTAARLMAASQRVQNLKFELLAPVGLTERGTAVMSCNYHLDHFAGLFEVRLPSGEPAHTACVGFGMERLSLALFRRHGFDIEAWPSGVRALLWQDAPLDMR